MSVVATTSGSTHANETLRGAIGTGTPIVDLRLRFEDVNQSNKSTAVATTIRARLGYQTVFFLGSLLPIDFLQHLGSKHFNDLINGLVSHPLALAVLRYQQG